MINELNNRITAPAREITGKVELIQGSTTTVFTADGFLSGITIQNTGAENYFFGIRISQKATIKIIDTARQFTINKGDVFKVYFTSNTDYVRTGADFYVSEVARDENTNNLTITGFDILEYRGTETATINIQPPYTIKQFAQECANQLFLTFGSNVDGEVFDTVFPTGANFDANLTLREAVEDIAEATQTIAYVNSAGQLYFKRLDSTPVFTVGRDFYKTLEVKNTHTLQGICSVNDLGDNLIAQTEIPGDVQYIRNNIFWTTEGDIASWVNQALNITKGQTIVEYNCDWRGNYCVEPGDAIAISARDGANIIVNLFNSTLDYDGGLGETSSCDFEEKEVIDANPSTIGEAINQTTARVDKVNKEIELLVGQTEENSEAISSLRLNADSISASVKNLQKATEDGFAGVNDDINAVNKRVDATLTADEVKLEISKELDNGVDKVVTKTGFRFDEEGMTVSKSGKAMTTTITEDGMRVSKNNETTLTANSTGVDAVNLHATTYLIIGENSRFEDVGDRTACFYIGR